MKLPTITLLACLVLFPAILLGQEQNPPKLTSGIDGVPNGQPIIYEETEGGETRAFATDNSLYVMEGTYFSSFYGAFKIYSPPSGTKIKSVVLKKGTEADYLVTLQSGKVVLLKPQKAGPNPWDKIWTPIDLVPIPLGSSSNAVEVEGDALYGVTTNRVYVSRDTGASWQIDTIGLGPNPFVHDLALDSAQNVYAAAFDGLYKQGPDSNRWYRTPGPQGAGASAVFVDRQDNIWTRFDLRGPYKSTDHGSSWIADTVGAKGINVDHFAQDIFGNIFAVNGNQVYRRRVSTGTWDRIDLSISASFIERSVLFFSSIAADTVLYLGTRYGLYTSADQGTSWQHLGSPRAETIIGYVQIQSGKKLSSTSLGVFVHNLADKSWTKVYPQSSFTPGNQLYTDSLNDVFNGFALLSTDEGATWNPVDTTGSAGMFKRFTTLDNQGGLHATSGVNSIVPTTQAYYKPRNGPWVYDTVGLPVTNGTMSEGIGVGGDGYVYLAGYFMNGRTFIAPPIFRKPVGGGSWQPDSAGFAKHRIVPSTFFPIGHNRLIATSTQGMILRDTNGVWRKLTPPSVPDFSPSYQITADSAGVIICAVTGTVSNFPFGRGIYASSDLGITWTKLGLDSIVVNGFSQGKDTIFAYTQNGLYGIVTQSPQTVSTVEVSVDSSWNLVSMPFTRDDNSANTLFPNRIPGSTYEYKKSYVGRDTLVPGKGYWTKFPSAGMDTLSGSPLASVSVSVDSGWNIIGSVDHATAVPSAAIITSNVYGYSHGYQVAASLIPGKAYWVKTNSNGSIGLGAGAAQKQQPFSLADLNTLIISDRSGNRQTLYFGAAIAASTDAFELPPPPPTGTFDARFSTQHMVELADAEHSRTVGLAVSSTAYPVTITWKMNARQTGKAVLVSGGNHVELDGKGELKLSNPNALTLTMSASTPADLPKEFSLDQNYPNPFNPSTSIKYTLAADAKVRLSIFNTLGQEVSRPVDAVQSAGAFTARIEAGNLASGVYFYRLDAMDVNDPANRFTSIKRMVLIK